MTCQKSLEDGRYDGDGDDVEEEEIDLWRAHHCVSAGTSSSYSLVVALARVVPALGLHSSRSRLRWDPLRALKGAAPEA
jgi:hypothetical protein